MKKTLYYLMFLAAISSQIYAQDNYQEESLLDLYQSYTELPRELSYVHLNKSTYIKGELLGFQAYVMDKTSFEPSVETTNLYVTISDASGKPLKKKLFRVQDGISQGNIEIDSLFTSGQYVIKAYTNWMRNFKEQNFFLQNFGVLDPDNPPPMSDQKEEVIDAQFLPEGGHMVAGTKNTIGIALKDEKGFGIPGVEGTLTDENQMMVSSFRTNDLGFAKCYLNHETVKNYQVNLVINGQSKTYPLTDVDPKGIALELKDLKDKIALAFRTNPATEIDHRRGYQLAIHNGSGIKIANVDFPKNTLEVLKVIPYADLEPGMNVITLLTQQNEPILERLFFKYDDNKTIKHTDISYQKKNDSILVTLAYQDIALNDKSSFSISVLPKYTKSYSADHNLVSYAKLQPHVRGYIENAAYYFEDHSPRRKYDMDLLLLNQGWSSYNWQTIFTDPPEFDYDFEKGVAFTANLRGKSGGQLLRYPGQGMATEFINLSTNETSFQRSSLFPIEGEKIRIGEILPDGKVKKPNLVVLFEPSSVPPLNVGIRALNSKSELKPFMDTSKPEELFGKVERLDEVIVTDKKVYTRIEKLRNRSSGKIEVFDDDVRMKYRYFSNYISQRGYIVDEGYFEQVGSETPGLSTAGLFRIVNRIQSTLSRGGAGNISSSLYEDPDDEFPPGTRDQITSGMIPSIYLNDILLADFDILYRFNMDQVDYIEVDRYGLGGGMRGGGGIIKIYTDPSRVLRGSLKFDKTYEEYALPLTFSKPSKYYTPKYNAYDNAFFRDYG
ncbi:MAG: hypothetical protein AB3N14_03695, partial [Flavobacteriaceae bacterium]